MRKERAEIERRREAERKERERLEAEAARKAAEEAAEVEAEATEEVAETVSCLVVHTTSDVESICFYLIFFNTGLGKIVINYFCNLLEGFHAAFNNARNVFLIEDDLTFEIGHDDADAVFPQVGSYEISGRGLQTIDARSASSAGILFSHILNEAAFYKLFSESGGRWYT